MAETILAARPGPAERLRRYLRLTKPRVNTLIVFCAVIGMFLAAPGGVPLQAWLPARSASPWWPARRRR
jgi:heme O synthase-like polyprenyltransferase